MLYLYIGECYSAIKKEGNPAIVTTWRDLEDITLSEMPYKKRQILYNLTYVCDLKTSDLQKQSIRWLPVAEEWGQWGDAGQRVQTLSYKMSKFRGSNVQHGD